MPHQLTPGSMIVSCFLLLAYVSMRLFQNHPFCMDEYNYWYQAKIFAAGHVFLPAKAAFSPLFEKYMLFHDGKLFSKFPPGFPLLLSLGIKFNVAGLINPLLSAASLLLIYLTATALSDRRYALLSIAMLMSNSYFLGYGASYFAQPLSLCLVCLAAYAYTRYNICPHSKWVYTVSVALALLFFVRPLDAACGLVGIGLTMFIRPSLPRKKNLLILTGTILAGLMLLAAYNKFLSGRLSITPYAVETYDMNVYAALSSPVTKANGIADFFNAYAFNFSNGTWPLLTDYFLRNFLCWIPLIVLAWCRRSNKNWPLRAFYVMSLLFVLLMVALYNLHPMIKCLAWPQYGARYWYPFLLPLTVMLALGIKTLHEKFPLAYIAAALSLCILAQSIQSYRDLHSYAGRFEKVRRLQADINATCTEKTIVVLHDPGNMEGFPFDFIRWDDLKRNPFMNGKRLYLKYYDNIPLVKRIFPDYTVCHYHFPIQETSNK